MFGVTADETGDESSQLLDEFVSLQKEMFSALGLHYRFAHTYWQVSKYILTCFVDFVYFDLIN